jgi:acetyl esterase/lipase
MKKLLFVLLFGLALPGFGQRREVLTLWPARTGGRPPQEKLDTLHKVLKLTDITVPLLEVHRPKRKANGAAVIVSPGGGNRFLAWNLEGTEVADWLNSLGYTAFVLQYSVPNQQKAALQDLQRALRVVRARAADFQLNPAKLGVMGFSAGGNLSARAATDFARRTYAPTDAADSTSARPDFALLIYPGSMATGEDRHLIPEIPVSAATPPVFVFVASDDPYNIPFGLGIALRASKIPFEFHVAPKGGHGYGLRKGNPAAEAWPGLAQSWLKAVL